MNLIHPVGHKQGPQFDHGIQQVSDPISEHIPFMYRHIAQAAPESMPRGEGHPVAAHP